MILNENVNDHQTSTDNANKTTQPQHHQNAHNAKHLLNDTYPPPNLNLQNVKAI